MRTTLAALAALTLVAAPAAAQSHTHDPSHRSTAHAKQDSAFAKLQHRGLLAMGVDQYTSKHRFESLDDGGRIELQRAEEDSAGAATIRAHLAMIAKAFKDGDFSTPAFVHLREVPGAATMAEKRAVITYGYRDLPRGGELRLRSSDPEAIKAIHEFLAFQRSDHRTGH